jgi:N-methylhydantoinase B
MTDAVEVALWNGRFASVAEEMGVLLRRCALSPNIKERRDLSCAVFDASGRLLAQADHIPVHLGSTALAVAAVLERARPGPGEVAIVNDPYAGGTHLPDLTLLAPVVLDGEVHFWVANRAHHADVGGAAPGSMAVVSHVDEEGLRIPPSRLDAEVVARLRAASRTPDEREGDLAAQRASLVAGAERLGALCRRHGIGAAVRAADGLIAYGERMMRAALGRMREGTFAFADSLDDDGVGEGDVPIRAVVALWGGRAVVDFSDSAPQVAGPVNAVFAVTLSATLYAFRCLAPSGTPTNAGVFFPIEVRAPAGSVVNATFPAPVAGGNVETSQRIVDVVLGALAQAMPDRIPAASQGTMNNLAFGGDHFAYYETVAGGAGGGPDGPGARAVHTHMTNTLNTPIEALEHALPVRVSRYAIRRGSGGGGRHPGGDGIVREIEFLEPATLTLLGDRRKRPPYGLRGGGPGLLGRDVLVRGGTEIDLASKTTLRVAAGDRVRVETPGGGGWGVPDAPAT